MRPVVGLDIDGTLVDYHGHFIRFANQYFGSDVPVDKYDARMPLHKYLGVGKVNYRKCKLAYRRGELKRSLPLLPLPFPQADRLTAQIRRWGVDIWLCTTRPYLSHDLVDEATRHNLRRNRVRFNGILWGEHKWRELVRSVGHERIIGVIDDLPEMCAQANGLHLPTAFAFRDHNRMQYAAGVGVFGGVFTPAIETHEETLNWLREQLDKWKANQ